MTPDTTKAIPGGVPQTGGATSIKIPSITNIPEHTHTTNNLISTKADGTLAKGGAHRHYVGDGGNGHHRGNRNIRRHLAQIGLNGTSSYLTSVEQDGGHSHDFKVDIEINTSLIKIANAGSGKAFDWQPQYFTVYKIMKYKSN